MEAPALRNQAPPRSEVPARSALASTVWTTIANAAIPAAALVTGPILARALGPSDRGALAAVLAPMYLAPLLITFGFPEAVVLHVGSKRGSQRATVRAALMLGVGSGAVAAGAVVLAAPYLMRHVRHYVGLLDLLALTLPPLMALMLLESVARGQRRFDLINRERWCWVLTRTAAIVALAAAGLLTVASGAWATHGTFVLAALVLLSVVRRARQSSRARATWAEAGRISIGIVRYGLRAWPAMVGGLIVLRIDQALIVPLSSARQLGLYAVAVSLAELPNLGLEAVRDVTFATAVDRGDPQFVAKATRTLVAICIPLAIVGVLAAPFVIPSLFGSGFKGAVVMAQVLFLSIIPNGVAGVVIKAGLMGVRRPVAASVVQMIAAISTVAALFVFVPAHGAIAAAWTTDAAYLISAGLGTIALGRVTGLPLRTYLVPRTADVRDLWTRLRRRLRPGHGAA